MRLRLVKFAEVRGEALTRSYNDKTHELAYIEGQRAIMLKSRSTGEVWFADQTGAEWYPLPPTAEVQQKYRDPNPQEEGQSGRPAAANPRPAAPTAQRPKR